MNRHAFAFLFPGQGSQSVGMGADLLHESSVRSLFEQADATLGFALTRVILQGPMEELTETRHAQPAILLHSLAVHGLLHAAGLRPSAVAGHSLGEFSAAAAAGALTPLDALRTVRRRGELMWEAGQVAPGAMSAVVGLDAELCQAVCAAASAAGGGVVVVANLNSPGQVVISGDAAAVAAVEAPLKAAGARRVLPLKVSGAFHSPLMRAAQAEFERFLATVPIHDASVDLYANVDAAAHRSAGAMRRNFVEQLVAPVHWQASVAAMIAAGIDCFVEVGPGNVLANLGARAFPSTQFFSTSDIAGVEKVLASLR